LPKEKNSGRFYLADTLQNEQSIGKFFTLDHFLPFFPEMVFESRQEGIDRVRNFFTLQGERSEFFARLFELRFQALPDRFFRLPHGIRFLVS
jgi:hypothetical protein